MPAPTVPGDNKVWKATVAVGVAHRIAAAAVRLAVVAKDDAGDPLKRNPRCCRILEARSTRYEI
jgi:hypothetical protein